MPTQTIPNWWKKVRLGEVYNISSWLWKWRKYFWKWFPFLSYKTIFNNFFVPEKLEDLVDTTLEEQEKFSIRRWDVFLTRTSEVIDEVWMSCVALKDYPTATFNWFSKRLRPKKGIDILPEYIAYFFRSDYFRNQVSNVCSIITRASLNNEILNSLSILLPPLPVQRKVASILSAYDELIENNNKRIKILESMGKAIFDDMMKQAEEKGELEEVELKKIVDLLWGFAFKSKEYDPNWEYKVVTIKNVWDGEFITSPINKISYIPEKMKEHCKLKNWDILLSLTWNVWRVCMVYGENYLLNQRVAKLSPKKDNLYSFVYTLFRSDSMKNAMNSLANWVAQQNLSPVQLSEKTIKIPPQQTLKNFNNQVKPILDEILNLQLQNQNLKQTRDLLIPQLVSGKLDVDKMEI